MGVLDGRVAIVTGAARGQGAAEAELFHKEGAQVVLADVLDEEGEALAASLAEGAIYRHLDVSQEHEWDALIGEAEATFGPISVLVNNAAILRAGSVMT